MNAVVALATKVTANVKLTKLEAKLVLILYRGQASEPLKAINRAEKEYSSTKLDPKTTVFSVFADQVQKIKDGGEAPETVET